MVSNAQSSNEREYKENWNEKEDSLCILFGIAIYMAASLMSLDFFVEIFSVAML